MSLARVYSRVMLGVNAIEVCVEAHLSNGLPGFAIVGMPETTVRESKERVRSAIINSGLEFPDGRITVNLAPADLPKSGAQYDLAIALGILQASTQIPDDCLDNIEIMGELALQGEVRGIQGAVPAILAARKLGREIILPQANAAEAELTGYERIGLVSSLTDYLEHVRTGKELKRANGKQGLSNRINESPGSFLAVKGQLFARRAVELAAAGSHNLLMIGPPGCGKTLLANNLIKLLPPLGEQHAMEVAAIRSVAGESIDACHITRPPMRSPHHSATHVALVGGGNRVNPGEISLAHRGVLFLDEFTEFKPSTLDALREPIENGEITVSRANYRVKFPARFQLVAAMNPCPCGNASDTRRECRCSSDRVSRYLGRLSGPLLDRMDLLVELPSLTQAELLERGQDNDDQSRWIEAAAAIQRCRQIQIQRAGKLNNELHGDELTMHCGLTTPLRKLLATTMDQLGMSARAVHRVIKVARTIADYEESQEIGRTHLLEAISYRRSRCVQKLGNL
jgi:magnesium chelatase family protein